MYLTPTAFNSVERDIDDFQLRKTLNELFQSKDMSVFEGDKLQEFCNEYIIDISTMRRCLEHLQIVELEKERGMQKRVTK